ncbi:MAG: phosphate-starvation-inducible PsiE family protein [Nitrospirota bacterium]|nr:phosphate-starvation-inducible PsiE family protein [Nitrospirota bacterium]MDE3117458.1 phosphate-starvation-inducible PsiE family protein [Nitrospirota bacterium]MDE3241436.1 phosphate-starvation-inducible PsiE family protein [Nitrospirota bacterium]
MSDRTDIMKHLPCQVVHWMEWLDRWGYVTAGFSLLLLGMLIFGYSWVSFIKAIEQVGLLVAGLKLLNDLLLVIILLELYRTVIRFLQTGILALEPYLAVGIIACTRRILTASAELSHQPEVTDLLFNRYLMDVGLNVVVIMVLIFAVFILRRRPIQPDRVAARADHA